MKDQIQSQTRRIFLVLAATLLCSLADAQITSPSGAFGFLVNSAFKNTFPDATGLAVLGVANFDGAGGVTGTYIYEVDARSSPPVRTTRGSFTGTYTSGPDGVGSLTMALDSGINLTFAMVIGENGQSLRLVATNYEFPTASCFCIVSGLSLSGTARAAAGGTLNGSYATLINNSPNVNASVGVVKFDGAGNVSLAVTFVGASNDKGQPPAPFAGTQPGTYTVNPDGSGLINLPAVPDVSNAQTFAFVVTDNGAGFYLIQLDRPGSGVAFGSAQLQ